MFAGGAAVFTKPAAAAADDIWPFASLVAFGGVPDDSSFDNALAFNAALSAGVTALYIPPGTWYFQTRPNEITCPLAIVGHGMSSTYLVRGYMPRSDNEGLLSIRTNGCRISQLGIGSGRNTAGASAIAIISDNTSIAGYTTIEDVYVSTSFPAPGGTWSYAVNIDGSGRTDDPVGARDVEIRNCSLFASTIAACRVSGGVAISIRGGFYPGGGSTGRVLITGSASVPSYYVALDATFLGGVSLDNCRYVNVRAAIIAGDITNSDTAENAMVSGACTGAAQKYWLNSMYVDPSAA